MFEPDSIRRLASDDVEACVDLVTSIGWDTDTDRWRRMLFLGEGHGVVVADGTLAGTIVLFAFGSELSMIGMMVVRPACQRRGVGRGLMEHALHRSRSRLSCLYATPSGERLYRRLGFVESGSSTRFEGKPTPSTDPPPVELRAMTRADLGAVIDIDQAAQGERREALITSLVDRHDGAWVVEPAGRVVAFGVAVSERGTRRLGPIVAPLDADAVALADRLALDAPRVLLDLEPGERVLRTWVDARGLDEGQTSLRMTLGPGVLPGARSWSRAIAGRPFG